ncbi:MAG: DapH/DapD/GlmU-related protein [Actinomycetaceae bacterium]|nr:DapH/DapD/GlmU-related protein [Actinomycetaceae bacterium]
MTSRNAWGVGLATVTSSGKTLDVWFPNPRLGEEDPELMRQDLERLAPLEKADKARGVHASIVRTNSDLDLGPESTAGAYLRLHVLSHRLAQPNTVNLEGLFDRLPNVVWTNLGPCDVEDFEETRLRIRELNSQPVTVRSVDRIPRMLDYVCPTGIWVANADQVRLGAHLAPGTNVGHAGFVNYNAGSLGHSTIEGRLSQGVVIDDGTDIGGGASTAGTLSGHRDIHVRMGKNCLLGPNAGLGIALGDNCVVEPGLYLTVGTRVSLMPSGGVMPGPLGVFSEPRVVEARDLSGVDNILFRRNSQSGRVEAVARVGQTIELGTE